MQKRQTYVNNVQSNDVLKFNFFQCWGLISRSLIINIINKLFYHEIIADK